MVESVLLWGLTWIVVMFAALITMQVAILAWEILGDVIYSLRRKGKDEQP